MMRLGNRLAAFVLCTLAVSGAAASGTAATAAETKGTAPAASGAKPPATAAAQEGWGPLQFLIGEWEAVAKPGGPTGWFSFQADVQGHTLIRRNHAEYPAANGRPAATHDDLLIVYRDSKPPALQAIYFDSEDHVIRYAVPSDGPGKATFLSDVVTGQPRYRLSYAALPDGLLEGKFEIAPPGKPEEFATYLEWTARRKAGDGTKKL